MMELLVTALVASVCGYAGSLFASSRGTGVLSADVKAEAYCLIFSAIYKLELTLRGAEIAESENAAITMENKETVDDAENEICRLHMTVGYMLPDHVNRELITTIDTSPNLGWAERIAHIQEIRTRITSFARKDMGQKAT